MSEINNAVPNPKPSAQFEVQSLLRRLLADVEAGKFKGIGVVMVPNNGIPPFMMAVAGEGFCEIHTGCGALQSMLVQSITMQSQSKVLRPIRPDFPANPKKNLFSGC